MSSSVKRSLMFADLAGSTALYEAMGNTQATRLVTDCTEAMGAAIRLSQGRVVKVLGDGVLATFPDPQSALIGARAVREAVARMSAKRRQLAANVLASKVTPTIANNAVDTQFGADQNLCVNVGIEHGDVVEHEQDVFGDVVNIAARLSDVAQNGEILVGEGAYSQLDSTWRLSCRSLSRIALKGKAQAMQVWRLELMHEMQTGPHMAYTMHVGSNTSSSNDGNDAPSGPSLLRLHLPNGTQAELSSESPNTLVLGRTTDAHIILDDPRISRTHATLAWQLDHFVLSDISSNGTWLRFGGASQMHTLRRSSMPMVGSGEIGLGAHVSFAPEVTLRFTIEQ